MQLQARYDIRAYEGILDCQFGMTIAQIHTILGFPDSSFKKAPTSECPTEFPFQCRPTIIKLE